MFRGRILIVSDRSEIVAELDPLIRAEGHLSLTVPNGDEALQVLEDGIVPDIIIGDLQARENTAAMAYLSHFRRVNHLGQYMAVPQTTAAPAPDHGFSRVEPFATLTLPLAAHEVRSAIQQAMDRIRRDLESLRGEMFRETARLQRAIREAQIELVTALAMMMEAKDPFMQGHCERVAQMARRVAAEMEMAEEEIEFLGTAALLHEIGKVAVSLELLHKDAPLTPTELEQIRAHTRTGAQMLSAVPSLRKLAPLVASQYTDFQHLDGTIDSGSREFLLASVLRVVDVFDAMTSNRSYRKVLNREAWEADLRAGAGTRFHPEVIDAFFRVVARDPS